MEKKAIDHRSLLGVMYLLFGVIHIIPFMFLLIIVLMLSEGGIYYRIWMTESVLLGLGIPGSVAIFSIIAGYGLYRNRLWANTAAVIAGVVTITDAITCSWLLLYPQMTTNRLLVALVYSTVCVGLCAYSGVVVQASKITRQKFIVQ